MRASTHQEVAQLLKDAVEYIMSDAKETAKTTAPQVASTTASKPAVRGTKLEVKEIQEVCVILIPQHNSQRTDRVKLGLRSIRIQDCGITRCH